MGELVCISFEACGESKQCRHTLLLHICSRFYLLTGSNCVILLYNEEIVERKSTKLEE